MTTMDDFPALVTFYNIGVHGSLVAVVQAPGSKVKRLDIKKITVCYSKRRIRSNLCLGQI